MSELFRTKDKQVNKNFEYTIGKITENSITLMDEVFDDNMENLILVEFATLSKKQIETYFKHSYCFTCHSRQGSTIKQPITIHQWDFKYATRKWLYTAITRTTEFDNVYFMIDKQFTEKQKKENEEKLEISINQYFRKKIQGYIQQDKNNNLDLNDVMQCDEYISLKWLKKCINSACSNGCGNILTVDADDNFNVSSNITAQRLNNDLPHQLDNIIPMCVYCNCSNK